MIPTARVTPTVPAPLPTCSMPSAEEITEEGFGFFRGTWLIGRVPLREAQIILAEEAQVIQWLDETASTAHEFELLASAIENQDDELLPDPLRQFALDRGLDTFLTDIDHAAPLDGLEIGVAGLSHALSAVRCLTAASCRWHISDRSWSDSPVVFFAARSWRIEILAEIVAAERCGLGQDRGLVTVYGASIRDTHRLARRILNERHRFRRIPDHARCPRRDPRRRHLQQRLPGCD